MLMPSGQSTCPIIPSRQPLKEVKEALSAALTDLSACATCNQESFNQLSMDQSIRHIGHFILMKIG